jgi:hypothetical protein
MLCNPPNCPTQAQLDREFAIFWPLFVMGLTVALLLLAVGFLVKSRDLKQIGIITLILVLGAATV